MQQLRERLKDIWREHQNNLGDRNQKLVEIAAEAIRDKKLKADAKVTVLNFIKAGGGASKESTVGMEGADRLELAKAFLQNAENARNALADNDFNSTLIESFKVELESYKTELKQLEEQIENAKSEDERLRAVEKRDNVRFKK